MSKVIFKGTQQIHMKARPCDLDEAALQITSDKIHLSEALAHHEPYVVLPPASASLSIREQAQRKIVDMMYAKRDAFRQAEQRKSMIPNESCNTDPGVGSFWYSSWGVAIYGNQLYDGITWEEAYGCQYLVFKSAQTGYNGGYIPNPDYWQRIRYSYLDVGAGCPFIGTNSYSMNLQNTTEGAGLTFNFGIMKLRDALVPIPMMIFL